MNDLEHNDPDQTFRDFMKEQLDGEVPPVIAAKAESRLAEFRATHAAEPVPPENPARTHAAPRLAKGLAWRWPIWIGVPVGLIVLFAIIASIKLNQATAYGQAVDTLRNARTMSMQILEIVGYPDLNLESPEGDFPRDPEKIKSAGGLVATFTYKDPGLFRSETAQADETTITIFDYTTERGLRTQMKAKTFTEMNANLMPQRSLLGDPIERFDSLPPHPIETVGERTLKGKSVVGHRVAWEGESAVLWLDARTDEIVEIHTQGTARIGDLTIYTDIKFNHPVDDSLFSLTPPDGFTKQLNALETIHQRLDKLRSEAADDFAEVPLAPLAITLWISERKEEALAVLKSGKASEASSVEILTAFRTRESDLPRLEPEKLQAVQSEFIVAARAIKEMCRAFRGQIDEEEIANRPEVAADMRKIHKGVGQELMKTEYATIINMVGEAIYKYEFK